MEAAPDRRDRQRMAGKAEEEGVGSERTRAASEI